MAMDKPPRWEWLLVFRQTIALFKIFFKNKRPMKVECFRLQNQFLVKTPGPKPAAYPGKWVK